MEVQELYSLCEAYNVPFHGVRLPKFTIEESLKKNLASDITNQEFLLYLANEGLKQKGWSADQKYIDRLEYEIGIITELGFVDYFLLVWDVVNFCKKNSIPVMYGRGSAPSSLILCLIGVTCLDPIKYGFYFERFISKIRAKKNVVNGITYLDGSLMCDVDLDFCVERRHEVEEYVFEKFKGKACKVLNISTYTGKSLIKDCAKILANVKESEANELSNRIEKRFGVTADLKKTYEDDAAFKTWADQNRRVYDVALKLRDLNTNKSVHASAVLVCHDNVENLFPTEFSSKKQVTVSSYTKDAAGSIAVKLDLLGLTTATIINETCKSIGIKDTDIDIENPFIYQHFQDLKTPKGIFQIEAHTCYGASQKVKPKNLGDLSVVSALARPGSLQFIDAYAKYCETGTATSVHPFFDDILKDTGSIVAFQEQLMAMIHKVGFSLDEAEQVRKIVGRKKLEEAKLWEDKIKNKVKERGLDPQIGTVLWDVINASANYSFNKCLSPDTMVDCVDGHKGLFEIKLGDKIKAFSVNDKQDIWVEVIQKYESQAELYEIELEDGRKVKCSMEHKFLCSDMQMHPLKEIISQDLELVCN